MSVVVVLQGEESVAPFLQRLDSTRRAHGWGIQIAFSKSTKVWRRIDDFMEPLV
jgi:hypothetical protein